MQIEPFHLPLHLSTHQPRHAGDSIHDRIVSTTLLLHQPGARQEMPRLLAEGYWQACLMMSCSSRSMLSCRSLVKVLL